MEFKPIKEVIKETKKNMEHIYDYATIGAKYLNCHDCNDCGRTFVCDYAPGIGELTRVNCPLWTEPETEVAQKTMNVVYIVIQSTKEHTYIVCVCADRITAEQKVKEYKEVDYSGHYLIESWKVR